VRYRPVWDVPEMCAVPSPCIRSDMSRGSWRRPACDPRAGLQRRTTQEPGTEHWLQYQGPSRDFDSEGRVADRSQSSAIPTFVLSDREVLCSSAAHCSASAVWKRRVDEQAKGQTVESWSMRCGDGAPCPSKAELRRAMGCPIEVHRCAQRAVGDAQGNGQDACPTGQS
jgi:hypothetical protein